MPQRVIALRESPEWNEPSRILTREAIPASSAILDNLQGRRGTDSRSPAASRTRNTPS